MHIDICSVLKDAYDWHAFLGASTVRSRSVGSSLDLPVAGLVSPKPLDAVVSQQEEVEKAAAGLGKVPPASFAILSFLTLPMIPELRLTDLGLVDVVEFKLV